jgi:hypothetical protein
MSSMNQPLRLRVDQREGELFKSGASEVRGWAPAALSDFPSDLCEGLVPFISLSPPVQSQEIEYIHDFSKCIYARSYCSPAFSFL